MPRSAPASVGAVEAAGRLEICCAAWPWRDVLKNLAGRSDRRIGSAWSFRRRRSGWWSCLRGRRSRDSSTVAVTVVYLAAHIWPSAEIWLVLASVNSSRSEDLEASLFLGSKCAASCGSLPMGCNSALGLQSKREALGGGPGFFALKKRAGRGGGRWAGTGGRGVLAQFRREGKAYENRS